MAIGLYENTSVFYLLWLNFLLQEHWTTFYNCGKVRWVIHPSVAYIIKSYAIFEPVKCIFLDTKHPLLAPYLQCVYSFRDLWAVSYFYPALGTRCNTENMLYTQTPCWFIRIVWTNLHGVLFLFSIYMFGYAC